MNEQIKINENILTINTIDVRFDHNIRDVKICGELIIVLLAIPFNETELDNLYAISKYGKTVWRVQGLNKVFPNQNNLPYEQMNVKENEITVTDFYARRYFINPLNGNIEKRDIGK
ncbi:hypothetical protein CDLVIII_1238 [Clostridium sp. DL-VIII]|uniref:hypothetical protein n=1 Tax=Clostridium sp. DL-VIII TaxID=641107 RepID=UPI00023AF6A4|nr:hypothetical protein [Clostridium sp. DL-VIII]EHI97938.1 hypothetical protein CDLVIII_1238 [Clostridium sp. DL-VIII]